MSLVIHNGYRWTGDHKTLSAADLARLNQSIRDRLRATVQDAATANFCAAALNRLDRTIAGLTPPPKEPVNALGVAWQDYQKAVQNMNTGWRETLWDFTAEWSLHPTENGLFIVFHAENNVSQLIPLAIPELEEFGYDSRTDISGNEHHRGQPAWHERGQIWEKIFAGFESGSTTGLGASLWTKYTTPFRGEPDAVAAAAPAFRTRVAECATDILFAAFAHESGVNVADVSETTKLYFRFRAALQTEPWSTRLRHEKQKLRSILPRRVTPQLLLTPLTQAHILRPFRPAPDVAQEGMALYALAADRRREMLNEFASRNHTTRSKVAGWYRSVRRRQKDALLRALANWWRITDAVHIPAEHLYDYLAQMAFEIRMPYSDMVEFYYREAAFRITTDTITARTNLVD